MSIWNFWDHWTFRNFVWLVLIFVIADYLVLPKTKHVEKAQINAIVEAINNRGKKVKNCVIAINIPSKWGNYVFESRRVNASICMNTEKLEEIEIVHTKFLKRWLYLKSKSETYYLPDRRYIFDILFIVIAIGSYFYIKNNEQDIKATIKINITLVTFIAIIMYAPLKTIF